MKSRGTIFRLVSLFFVLVCIVNVNAYNYQPSSLLQSDGVNYTITLGYLDANSVRLEVNNSLTQSIGEQSQAPYSVTYRDGLSFINKESKYYSYVGPISYADVLIGIEKNITDGDTITLIIDGKEYNLTLEITDPNSAVLTINGLYPAVSLSEQVASPYYLSASVDNLSFVAKKIFGPNYVTPIRYVTLLIFYERNISNYCEDVCDIAGEKVCNNSNAYLTCGDYNSDTCLEWSSETICNPGQICSNEDCISIGTITCSQDTECYEASAGAPYCKDNNTCYTTFSNKCINPGTTQSYCNSTTLENCNPCSNGCKNNQCVNNSQPTKECTLIGLRQAEKYCSTQYKLVTQKENNIICENDFECKNNLCLENKCAIKINSLTTYIIVGAVIVVLLIIIFFISLRRR